MNGWSILRRHPAVGLRVTISGKHHLSGYHGFIRDVHTQTRPVRVSVEVEATREIKIFEAQHLALQRYVCSLFMIKC